MKLWVIINLYWIFSALKNLTAAQWQAASGGTRKASKVFHRRQAGALFNGLGNAAFGNLLANGFGGLGAASNLLGGIGGNLAGLGNPQAAGGFLGVPGFGVNPFALGAQTTGLGTMQGLGTAPFGGALMGAANPLMGALAQGLNAPPLMNGLGGMDTFQQLSALRFAPTVAANPLVAMMQGGQGLGAGGMGLNFLNGGGMGMTGSGLGMNTMNTGGFDMNGAGMGLNGFGGGGAGLGAGLNMGNGMGGGNNMGGFGGANGMGGFGGGNGVGGFGGGLQQNMGNMGSQVSPHPFLLLQGVGDFSWPGLGAQGGGGDFRFSLFGPSPGFVSSNFRDVTPYSLVHKIGFPSDFSPPASWPPAFQPFLKLRKRWSKTGENEEAAQNDGKIPFSSVIDALKQATKTSEDDDIDSQEATSCGGCVPLDLRKITGSWTQIYGNPDSLRAIYTSLSALKTAESDDRSEMGPAPARATNKNDTSVQPSCAGFHFERPFPRRVSDAILGEAPVSIHFRDDQTYRLYQVSGMVQQSLIPNQSEVRLRISTVDVPLCFIKGGGPTQNGDYDYAIFMETRGAHRCKALHVIARNSDTFFHNYSSDVTEFLQQKVRAGEAHTIKIMPSPEQCEPRQQQQQWQMQQQDKEGSL